MTVQYDTDRPGFAVVGLGKMGIMHAAMLNANPAARVAALVDRDLSLCRHVGSMGIDAPHYEDLPSCLREAKPAGVIIATPQFTHRGLIETSLDHGTPVFSEKPLAHCLSDARAVIDESRRTPNIPVAVGYQLAHHALFQKASDMIRSGLLGTLKSFQASCRLSQVFKPQRGWTFTLEKAGGGVLINSGCHLLYALNMIFGTCRGVFSRGSGVHNTVEDVMGAILDYDHGLWGTLQVTWSVPGHELQTHDIEIIGTEGTLMVGNEWMRLWLARKTKSMDSGWHQWERTRMDPKAAFSLSPHYCGDEFYLEIDDFVQSVNRGRKPRVGLDEALDTQVLLEAIYRSIMTGQYVHLNSV
jgi:predicted dehydrogenase